MITHPFMPRRRTSPDGGRAEERSTTMIHEAYLSRPYVPELDGLRAIAILIVISVHMDDAVWDWLAGRLGVTIFFVLSGYLITSLGLREERSRGHLHLPAFFVRRAFRLFPLYYAVLLAYCVLIFGLGFGPEKRAPFAAALPYQLFYFQEWPAFLGVGGYHANIPFTQSWSLGIEEKFYLVWAFLGFAAWRGSGAVRRRWTAALMILMTLSPAIAGGTIGQFFYPYSHLLVGCLTALLLDDPAWFGRMAWLGRPRVAWLALALFLTVHFTVPPDAHPWERLFHSTYSLSTALFLVAVLLGDGPIQRSLRRPGLVAIGKLSYGMYLVHLLVENAVEKIAPPGTGNILVSLSTLLLTCGLSAALAAFLAVTIERPGIAMGRRLSGGLLRRGAASRETGPDPIEGPAGNAGLNPTGPAAVPCHVLQH
jgi:peptidoglycan/LPS O-acetylase OafA/YrhL